MKRGFSGLLIMILFLMALIPIAVIYMKMTSTMSFGDPGLDTMASLALPLIAVFMLVGYAVSFRSGG